MDKDIPRFCLDFDQRVLDKKLSKDTHRIFKRNIVPNIDTNAWSLSLL